MKLSENIKNLKVDYKNVQTLSGSGAWGVAFLCVLLTITVDEKWKCDLVINVRFCWASMRLPPEA